MVFVAASPTVVNTATFLQDGHRVTRNYLQLANQAAASALVASVSTVS